MKEPDPKFLSLDESMPSEPASARRRFFTFGAASIVTVGGLATALVLGTIGYDIRRTHMHEARLKGILVQTPTVYQVTEGLKEKAPMVRVVNSEAALREAIQKWGRDKGEQIVEKAERWPQLRIYDAGDMMYFVYFDEENIMRDFLYVSASRRD